MTFTNNFEDRLTAAMHSAIEYQYDQCDHGTYTGGHQHGEPYEMCRIHARRLIESKAVADPWAPETYDEVKRQWLNHKTGVHRARLRIEAALGELVDSVEEQP